MRTFGPGWRGQAAIAQAELVFAGSDWLRRAILPELCAGLPVSRLAAKRETAPRTKSRRGFDVRSGGLSPGCAVLLLEQVADLNEQLGLGGSRLFFDDAGLARLTRLEQVHRVHEDEVHDEGYREE